MVNQTLLKIIEAFSDNAAIVGKAAFVMKNPDDYNAHLALREEIQTQKLYIFNLIKAYMVEFHEFMYVIECGERRWRCIETDLLHCDVKKDGKTLPAIVSPAREVWMNKGKRHNTDTNEFGHTLPAEVSESTSWAIDNILSRADICKDPSSPDFGKALPAHISTTGVRRWWLFGTQYKQWELTRILKTNFNIGVLDDLVKEMPDIKTKVDKIKENIFIYRNHYDLKKFLIGNHHSHPAFLAYYDEFHNFMYDKNSFGKRWYKPGTALRVHSTKTFLNEATGLVETYPAKIDDDGDLCWMIDGEYARKDLDEIGNTLHSFTSKDGTRCWRRKGSEEHRFEISQDGKALPSVIHKDGGQEWFYKGNKVSQDYLTKKFTKKHIIDNVESYESRIVDGRIQLIIKYAK